MEQRSNDAAVKDAQILLRKEECASSMGQRSKDVAGVSNHDGNEICGVGNAPAFAPYLEMIVFRTLRIGVSSFFGFRIFG